MTANGSNMIELHLDNKTIVLFSYKTPVAALIPLRGYVRTEEFYSVTTSRHINKWVAANATKVPQAEIDALLGPEDLKVIGTLLD